MAISKYAGVTDFCTCDIAVWIILTIVSCVVLFLATGPFYYYISVAPDDEVNVSFFAISASMLMILSILGFIGAIKKWKPVLLYFSLIMLVMVMFTVAQITLTFVALSNCGDVDDFFHFMCEINEIVYFAHSTVIIVIGLVCAVCAFMLRRRLSIQENDPDNVY
eukprot:TRINITY_DN10247_c0_g1_i1.p1 TRINITY_DN10247_c0_g1~~TRINITY_DN10247_c0_g1_i1.p1  ORF type:complete len:164 (-),score=32.95 TRINITY_DN10247_c0_g1_i1:120-611(-)